MSTIKPKNGGNNKYLCLLPTRTHKQIKQTHTYINNALEGAPRAQKSRGPSVDQPAVVLYFVLFPGSSTCSQRIERSLALDICILDSESSNKIFIWPADVQWKVLVVAICRKRGHNGIETHKERHAAEAEAWTGQWPVKENRLNLFTAVLCRRLVYWPLLILNSFIKKEKGDPVLFQKQQTEAEATILAEGGWTPEIPAYQLIENRASSLLTFL